jgi:hypothetical protein
VRWVARSARADGEGGNADDVDGCEGGEGDVDAGVRESEGWKEARLPGVYSGM